MIRLLKFRNPMENRNFGHMNKAKIHQENGLCIININRFRKIIYILNYEIDPVF